MSIVAGVAYGLDGVSARRARRDPGARARLQVVPDPVDENATTGAGVAEPARGWRLTRRGRVVVLGFLVALLTAGTVGLGAARALNASTEVPQREVSVVVAEGDTLWTIAASVAPGSDRQETVERIRQANRLGGSRIEPGQELVVPVVP